ncbi:sulfurtransferase TusA family protein, partial [Pseudomonas aeruginosa]
LATMQPGERLEVVTDCSQSVHGIPEDTQRQGYKCLAVEQHGALFRFLIEVPLES